MTNQNKPQESISLKYKIILYAMPLVLVLSGIMIYYENRQIKIATEETYEVYMHAITRAYVDQELSTRHALLEDAGLQNFPLYVDRYLNEAMGSAGNISRREEGALYLVKDQKVLSTMNSRFDDVVSNLLLLEKFRQKEAGFINLQSASAGGSEQGFLAYWLYAPDWDIKVVFIKSDADLEKSIRGLGISFILISIVVLILTVSHIVFVYNWLVLKPIVRLSEQAKRISKKDFSFEVVRESDGEIGQLEAAMENMRHELADYQSKMQEWNKSLQDEVAIKTADLEAQKLQLDQYNIKLEASNKELEQFAYVASHDLQEPLRTISSFLSLIERGYKGKLDKEADEYIFYAVDGAERLKMMIRDLLALSRVATRGAEFAAVNLETCFDNVLANLKLKIEENNAKVQSEKLPTVVGDSMQLSQLLQNLVDNAIKYRSDDDPEITVRADLEGNFHRISVIDNGIGIPDEYQEKAFMVFQRLHSDRSVEGSGIGLAVCKKIVNRHGGVISSKQMPEGGTCISFTIPVMNNQNEGQDDGSN